MKVETEYFGVTLKEVWTIFHGTILGGAFLLLFPAAIAGLFFLNNKTYRFLVSSLIAITILAWLTNITGTYLPYAWYSAEPPEGIANLFKYPRSYLLSNPSLAIWHKSGMEWKEFLGWIAPLLSTPAAYILLVYEKSFKGDSKLKMATVILLIIAFAAAAITALIGIMVTKLAPVR